MRGIEDFINIDENEDLQYFFVSDHLGSSSFITDVGGDAVQHLQYMPFGEHFVNQTSTSWETPYKFSGKEKDSKTGYSYFGARYYNSDLSVWLSVDPMSDMYPMLSPYVYVANNPILYCDPDGKKIIFPNLKTSFGYNFQMDINKLYETKHEKALIRMLHSTKVKIIINDASRFYLPDSWDVRESETKGGDASGHDYWSCEESNLVFLQYAQRTGVIIDGVEAKSYYVLAHELFHAKDIVNGYLNRERVSQIPKGMKSLVEGLTIGDEILEVRAIIQTNLVRKEMGDTNLRTDYNGVKLIEDDGVTPVRDYGFNVTNDITE